jgi:hypothetical protein
MEWSNSGDTDRTDRDDTDRTDTNLNETDSADTDKADSNDTEKTESDAETTALESERDGVACLASRVLRHVSRVARRPSPPGREVSLICVTCRASRVGLPTSPRPPPRQRRPLRP